MSAPQLPGADEVGRTRCQLCDAVAAAVEECGPGFIVVRTGRTVLLGPRRHVQRWRDLSSAEQTELARRIGAAQALLETQTAQAHVRLVETGGHAHFRVEAPLETRGPLPGLPHDRALISGGDDALHAHLRPLIDRATAVDLSVSFLMTSGMQMVLPHLRDLLARGGRLRLLTGDYLDVTEPNALRLAADLEGDRALYVFQAAQLPFHPKAWIFSFAGDGGALIVGSSNLSRSALSEGIEWNLRHVEANDPAPLAQARAAFDALLDRPEVVALTPAWIDAYDLRRVAPRPDSAGAAIEAGPPAPVPHAVQEEALRALRATRERGYRAGLVVLATGLGKTFLAAFDSIAAKRVLFVAHREEILAQALNAFRCVRPTARLGRFSGADKDTEADVVFASVQTLSRGTHLARFASDAFDYIVVDEFHHAAAATYRRIVNHFSPNFLLGLTATPDRTDGADLLGLCEENLAYECDLWSGIERGLLAPFRYFGVPDPVEYANIPWRSGRFDETALTAAVATEARAANALEQLARRGGKRALGFCVSRRHADFMADFASRQGLRAVAVHSGDSSAPRASALQALADGDIDVVFAVDMFNEGVDVPAIDTVLMLRPTESPIVWLQQLGRGLRRSAQKSHLAVIDYIGNHRTFLSRLRTLLRLDLGGMVSDGALRAALQRLQDRQIQWPEGCEVTYDLEAINVLVALLKQPRDVAELVAFYQDFSDRHGVRPTACDAEQAGFNPGRTGHDGWIGFVNDMGDLTAAQEEAWKGHRDFLEEIETTPMTRGYKMLVLRAMIDANALPGRIALHHLVEGVARLARRNPRIRADLSVDPDDAAALRALLVKHPLSILAESAWFRLEDEAFATAFPALQNGALASLASELVDWRLLRHFRKQGGTEPPERVAGLDNDHNRLSALQPAERPRLALWHEYQRDKIAPYFESAFNSGSWNSGVVVVEPARAMILLVTMDKTGMSLGSEYTDYFSSPTRFVWHSQNEMRRDGRRGRIISSAEPGWSVHLFFRLSKLRDGRAAPFRYAGPVRFSGWDGDAPITVQWDLTEGAPKSLWPLLGLEQRQT